MAKQKSIDDLKVNSGLINGFMYVCMYVRVYSIKYRKS